MPTTCHTKHLSQLFGRYFADAVVSQFQGVEAFSQCYYYRLKVHSPNSIDPLSALHQPLGIRLTHPSKDSTRDFHGIVYRISCNPINSGGLYPYSIILAPQLALLKHTSNCRIFHQLSALDITQTLLREHHITHFDCSAIQQKPPVLEHCTQFNESTYDFISRILASEGIGFYFTYQVDRHMLKLFQQTPPLPSRPTTFRLHPPLTDHTNQLAQALIQHQHTCESVAGSDYFYSKPQQNTTITHGINDKKEPILKAPLEQYHFPVHGQTHQANQKTLQLTRQHIIASAKQLDCFSRNLELKPGQQLVIDNIPVWGQIPLVIHRLSHHWHDQDNATTTNNSVLTTTTDYHNQFVAKPVSMPFVPELLTKPQMPGTQTAIVIGYQASPVDTDQHARIKVKFHWDRSTQSSSWIRCQQAMAGNQWGSLFLPRIGSEVVVDFINQDPDQPIVVGNVYNAMNQAPFPITQPTLNGIKTQSFSASTTSDSANQLQFEDTPQKASLKLIAQNDLVERINQNYSATIGQSHNTVINSGDQTITCQTGEFTLTTSQEIHLRCNDSFIKLDSNGITIQGSTININ